MRDIVVKCAESNYENYQKYYDENKANMSVEENAKCFAKLKRLEQIYIKEAFEKDDNLDIMLGTLFGEEFF